MFFSWRAAIFVGDRSGSGVRAVLPKTDGLVPLLDCVKGLLDTY